MLNAEVDLTVYNILFQVWCHATQKVGEGLRPVADRAGVFMRKWHYHYKDATAERHNLTSPASFTVDPYAPGRERRKGGGVVKGAGGGV